MDVNKGHLFHQETPRCGGVESDERSWTAIFRDNIGTEIDWGLPFRRAHQALISARLRPIVTEVQTHINRGNEHNTPKSKIRKLHIRLQ